MTAMNKQGLIMPDFLEFTVDKFTFKVASDRLYTREGLWVKRENNHFRVGISDYLQQRSGDMAFVEIQPAGTRVNSGDELIVVETIKVNISLASPITGEVIEVNPAMESTPEIINKDPYGAGWLVVLESVEDEEKFTQLMDPQAYLTYIKHDVEQETRNQ